MAKLLLVLAIVLIYFTRFGYCQDAYNSTCNPDDYSAIGDLPLPQLPDQYYFAVEAVIVNGRNSSRTIFAEEYFDRVGDRGRFDYVANGYRVRSITDYKLKESFVFPNVFTGDDCTVSILSANASNRVAQILFGVVPGENNTVHIGSPSTVFYFGVNQSQASYLGVVNDSSGVIANRWQVCVDNENRSYTIDYYFTNGSLWKTPYLEQGPVPVAIELAGWRRSGTRIFDVYHRYNFVNYQSGPEAVQDDVFSVPLGLICKGRLPGQSLPQLPRFFSTAIQTIRDNVVVNAKEYYDFPHDLLRIDVNTPYGPTTIIHDFNADMQYIINNTYSTCKAEPITSTNSAFDGSMDANGQYRLKDSRHLFFIDQYDFVYQGVRHDGPLLDAWIAYKNDSITFQNVTITNSVYQLFMTRPGQAVRSIYGVSVDPLPWQISFSGNFSVVLPNGTKIVTNISQTSFFYDFAVVEPPFDVFDVSVCFNDSDFIVLAFRLPGHVVGVNQNNLRSSIRAALVDYANATGSPFISPLQIANSGFNLYKHKTTLKGSRQVDVYFYQVEHGYGYNREAGSPVGSINSEEIIVSVYIIGNSARSIVDQLTDGLETGDKLPIVINFENSNVTPILALTDTPDLCPACSSCFPAGGIAGITIATFVLGILCGIVVSIIACMYLRKGTSVNLSNLGAQNNDVVRYERQLDDDQEDTPSSDK